MAHLDPKRPTSWPQKFGVLTLLESLDPSWSKKAQDQELVNGVFFGEPSGGEVEKGAEGKEAALRTVVEAILWVAEPLGVKCRRDPGQRRALKEE